MTETEFIQVRALLKNKKRIVVCPHVNPDGDAIGSGLGLAQIFSNAGHMAQVVLPNDVPDFYRWMPGYQQVVIHSTQKNKAEELIKQADILVVVDYNDAKRAGELESVILESKALRIMIDHHLAPTPFCRYIYSDITSSSTAELVYDFAKQLKYDAFIDVDAATNLYVGIMTDTGSFSFSANLPKTYYVTADLIAKGVDARKAHVLVYDSNTADRIRLLGYSLSEALVILPAYHTAYIKLSKQELDRFNYKVGDTEGLVNYALSIEGIGVAVLFTEKNDKVVKLSMRSKGNFSVNELARTHFVGGGHKNAAGAEFEGNITEAVHYFVTLLDSYKSALISEYGQE